MSANHTEPPSRGKRKKKNSHIRWIVTVFFVAVVISSTISFFSSTVLDGQVFLDENNESYCVWRAEFDEEENCCYYGIDLFRRRGALWARSFEQHCEYAYDPDTLEQWLREAGFARVECFGDRTLTPPGPDEQRMYFAAWKE